MGLRTEGTAGMERTVLTNVESRDNARAYLYDSADVKRVTAAQCADAIVAAAEMIAGRSAPARRCCCAEMEAAPPTASTWPRSS